MPYGPHFFTILSEKFGQLARFFWANGLPPPLAKSFPYAYGSIVWNLLEPSAVSARDYTKRAKKSPALRNLNFNEKSEQMGRPQIDSDFVFY